jgi:hypothetical protein
MLPFLPSPSMASPVEFITLSRVPYMSMKLFTTDLSYFLPLNTNNQLLATAETRERF